MLQEYQGVLFYSTRFIEAHLEVTSRVFSIKHVCGTPLVKKLRMPAGLLMFHLQAEHLHAAGLAV